MWSQESEGWELGSQPWDQGSQAILFGTSSFLRDEGFSCTIFVGSGTKICHGFGIKDKKFSLQKWHQR